MNQKYPPAKPALEMRMSNDMISKTLEAMPVPIAALGYDGRIMSVNSLVEELLGSNRLNMHYITAFRQPQLLDAIEASLEDGTRRVSRLTTREGARDVTWRVTIAPGTQNVALFCSFEDVSPMEQAEQMRRDFVANVSHELRTPLTALLGFIETLQGAAREDAVARDKFLAIMAKEADRMSRLVEDLLSLSRVEETERVRPMDSVDLRDLVCQTCTALQGLAARAGIRLTCDMDEGAFLVAGDEGQLRQVVTNLVENGIKYGASGNEVKITLSRHDHIQALRRPGISLSVRDFGDGIAPHHIPRLTERFYRADAHRSREVGGTGLGLAIVKHIVNRHRGTMRIESKQDAGALFQVNLPLK